ncbi:MAG: ABC transporter ATP-binding protein [Lachnospirales bacterium]
MEKNVIVSIKNVNKIYDGGNHVVKNLNLDVYEGEFLTLLGSSGCGKTTTLRMIAGFEEITSGNITVEGVDIADKEPYERNVNTVFQSYALFPHMTIYDNVAYGLKMKKVSKAEIAKRVPEILELVQLGGFEHRYPSQLSGGQKQRVAIARALINNPRVLLLDEPLGALDLKLRKQMQLELKRLQRKLNITFIYVTHDQEEALSMSDRIAIMNNGVLEQIDVPEKIYEDPQTQFVATFIGETNIFEGCVNYTDEKDIHVMLECGHVVARGDRSFSPNEMVVISIRPERIQYSETPRDGFTLKGIIKEQVYVGSVLKTIIVLPNGHEIKIERLAGQKIPVSGDVYVYWDVDDAKIIPSESNRFFRAIEDIIIQ